MPAVIEREEVQVHRFHRTFEMASCGVSIGSLSGFKQLVEWADVVHYHFPGRLRTCFTFWAGSLNRRYRLTTPMLYARKHCLDFIARL